ncbi:oleate hydratase [Actinomadura oligospora]|uniref:oleate hydratase n=1 Tax=Actinomadura oligospora TaxID=111804 RepID=UPI0004B53BE8|nr:oleate hydratase [Actinomadura oligospora]
MAVPFAVSFFSTAPHSLDWTVHLRSPPPAKPNEGPAPAWDLWRRIASKDPAFGRPDVFGSPIPETKWESATVTTLDERIPRYIQKICKRDPFSGRVVTGGIVTVRDSAWLLSWTVNRQPHFKQQPEGQIVAWLYSLFVDVPGDYVKKPMQECTGEEIVQEWLYHLGVPEEEFPGLAATGAKAVPVMMPYVRRRARRLGRPACGARRHRPGVAGRRLALGRARPGAGDLRLPPAPRTRA